jgi:hypothetical protein
MCELYDSDVTLLFRNIELQWIAVVYQYDENKLSKLNVLPIKILN